MRFKTHFVILLLKSFMISKTIASITLCLKPKVSAVNLQRTNSFLSMFPSHIIKRTISLRYWKRVRSSVGGTKLIESGFSIHLCKSESVSPSRLQTAAIAANSDFSILPSAKDKVKSDFKWLSFARFSLEEKKLNMPIMCTVVAYGSPDLAVFL